jgi:hypothetical protein
LLAVESYFHLRLVALLLAAITAGGVAAGGHYGWWQWWGGTIGLWLVSGGRLAKGL